MRAAVTPRGSDFSPTRPGPRVTGHGFYNRELTLPPGFFRERDRLRRAYRVLHGNWRRLEFFAAAVQGMDAAAEETFLARLARAEAEVQAGMALETVVAHRSESERALLERLPAYRTPVPEEGVIKLALDLPEPERLLEALLAVSLVGQREAPDLLTREYQCSPLVATWLKRRGTPAPHHRWLKTAADCQLYLYRRGRPTLAQATADRWALDRIIGPLNRAGLYSTLLATWLPPICDSQDPALRAEALGQTGKQHLHMGSYETALSYLKQSLAIRQEIGDSAGLCATLFDMGHIHLQNGEQAEALQAWVTVYRLARPMSLAQALDALEGLAGQLGLPGGLDGWEMLARRMDGADGGDPQAGS